MGIGLGYLVNLLLGFVVVKKITINYCISRHKHALGSMIELTLTPSLVKHLYYDTETGIFRIKKHFAFYNK